MTSIVIIFDRKCRYNDKSTKTVLKAKNKTDKNTLYYWRKRIIIQSVIIRRTEHTIRSNISDWIAWYYEKNFRLSRKKHPTAPGEYDGAAGVLFRCPRKFISMNPEKMHIKRMILSHHFLATYDVNALGQRWTRGEPTTL